MASPSNHQREVETDEIPRKHRSGEHGPECKQESRIIKLESKVDEHDKRLGAGDVGFAELRKDVATLTEKVSELIGVLKWGAFGIIGFVATVGGGALVWVVVQSGGKVAGQ